MSTLPEGRKISHHPFFRCNAKGDNLFAVRTGIPVNDALEQASCLLAAAHSVGELLAQHERSSELWAVNYLIEMSKAVIDAIYTSLSDGTT